MRRTVNANLPPDGFQYEEELILPEEEAELIRNLEELPLKEFEFHGYTGKRRVVSFGWHYDFGSFSLNRVEDIPAFLKPLRGKAAAFAHLSPDDLPHVLVTEYTPGTPIGWHRDKAVFDDVIGISLGSACRFRFRRRSGDKWERYALDLQPRSFYLLRGPARTDWEHSIPAVEDLRYSITFRSVRQDKFEAQK
jgi:alkylated DNA repair dioxygenase AlkB